MNSIRLRLSVMMFFHFLILGSWMVTLATYLMSSPLDGGLNFSASLNSLIYSTLAVAGLLAPLLVGLLADRLFSAQRIMVVFYVCGGLFMFAAAWWCEQRAPLIEATFTELLSGHQVGGVTAAEALESGDPVLRAQAQEVVEQVNQDPAMLHVVSNTFGPLFVLMLFYSIVTLICGMLCNVTSLRNLADPKRSFGSVRVMGTIGWIVSALLIGLVLDPISAQPLRLAGAVSLGMGAYALFLPNTPPINRGTTLTQMLGLPALKLLREVPFAVFVLCAIGLSAVQQFYALYANKFLTDLGAPKPTAVQALSQAAEVVCMLLFPLALPRLGIKGMMLLGLVGWVLRNALFATGAIPLVVGIGLPLHGLCFSFFFIVGNIYVDQKAPPHLRASAQGIMVFSVTGVGFLSGNYLAALVKNHYTLGTQTNWTEVWLIPCLMAAVISVVFLLFFRTEPARPGATPSTSEPIAEDPELLVLGAQADAAVAAESESRPAAERPPESESKV